MSQELVSSLAGGLLALAFFYIPGIRARFDTLDSPRKALVMLIALAAVTVGAFGLGCLGWFDVPVTCDQAGAEGLISVFFAALFSNQATYQIAVKPAKQPG